MNNEHLNDNLLNDEQLSLVVGGGKGDGLGVLHGGGTSSGHGDGLGWLRDILRDTFGVKV